MTGPSRLSWFAHAGRVVGVLATLVLIAACSKEPETGPGEVRWDQETCARCIMAISDPNYAAQIRYTPPVAGTQGTQGATKDAQAASEVAHKKTDAKPGLYKFDDIGCAVIWLDRQSWKDSPGVELWVTDYQSGDWIDATTASYIKGRRTPMAYGLGASKRHDPGTMSFAEAKAHIMAVEEQFNPHSGQPLESLIPGESADGSSQNGASLNLSAPAAEGN